MSELDLQFMCHVLRRLVDQQKRIMTLLEVFEERLKRLEAEQK